MTALGDGGFTAAERRQRDYLQWTAMGTAQALGESLRLLIIKLSMLGYDVATLKAAHDEVEDIVATAGTRLARRGDE